MCPDVASLEPITGNLLRQCPRWFWGRRWVKHKFIFDGDFFRSFRLPELQEEDQFPVSEIAMVEALLLVPARAPVVPPHARAEAPPGGGQSAGLILHLHGKGEIVLCAETESERNRWVQGLRRVLESPPPDARSVSKASEPMVKIATPCVTQPGAGPLADTTPGAKGEGKGKGKGKGKAPPAPSPKQKAPPAKPKAVQTRGPGPPPKPAPKIHGLMEKFQAPRDIENTIFNATSDSPHHHVSPTPFVVSDDMPTTPRRGNPLPLPRDDGVKLLDAKVAQELGVVVARLKVQDIAVAALTLESTDHGLRERLDNIEILCEAMTRQERDPLAMIQNYLQEGNDPEKLRKIERSLVPLARVPRAVQRLRLLLVEATMDERLAAARRRLDVLAATAQDLESSSLLRDVVRIIQESMDWNFGAAAGAAGRRPSRRAFHVGEQLGKLKTIRPPGVMRTQVFAGYSFVHWLVEELTRWGRNLPLGAFAAEAKQLQLAAKTNPSLVYEDLSKLRNASKMSTYELREHAAAYASGMLASEPVGRLALPARGLVAAATADLLTAREPTPAEAPSGESAAPVRRGPECFALSLGGEDPEIQALAASVAETYELDEVSCGRPTLTPDNAPRQYAPPSAWDPKNLLASDRLRKLPSYKAGTFARAPRVSSIVGLRPPLLQEPRPSVSAATALGGQGFIWLLMAHKTRKPTWQKCWADVRGHHLIYRQLHRRNLGHEALREGAIPLPGAEVFKLESLLASDLARWLSSLRVRGLELRPAESASPIIFCVDGPSALDKWEAQLTRAARSAGVGNLDVRLADRRTESRHWCVIIPDEKKLLCYGGSLDIVLGAEPKHSFDLENAEVQTFSEAVMPRGFGKSDSSQPRRYGFSLRERVRPEQDGDVDAAKSPEQDLRLMASFVVPPPGDCSEWHGTLQMLCAASELQNNYAEEANKDGSPRRSSRPSSFEDDPFSKLENSRPSCAPRNEIPVGITSLLPMDIAEEEESDKETTVEPEDMEALSRREKEDHAPQAAESPGCHSDRSRSDDSGSEASLSAPPHAEVSDVSDDDEQLEPGPLANLRRLARTLRCQSKALDEELRAEECAARTTLAFFDEQAPPGGALATLQVFFAQVANFALDFDEAIKRVRDDEAARAKPKSKAKASGSVRLERSVPLRDASRDAEPKRLVVHQPAPPAQAVRSLPKIDTPTVEAENAAETAFLTPSFGAP